VKSPGSARGSPSGLPGKPALAAFLLGLAAALGLFAWTRDWRAALPAACVAAAAAFWLLARARAAGALEEEGRRTGEIEGRVKALREERLRKDSGIEALEARLAAVRGERLQASERLDRDLDAWGVRTVDALSDLRSDLALKGEALRAREEELRRALDAPEVPADGIGPLLERRLADLREARAGLEAGPPERSAAEWEAERAAAGRRRGELLDRKDSLSERLREMSLALGERKGGLGGEPCGIFESLQEARRNEEDVDLWREAAAMAARVMREVEGDAESAMRGCLGEAARLFRELTGGAYSDVEMEEGGSIFEPSSLKVRHRGLGAHPLEWMSSGAQDLLWLSLRLTLAARMFPETALLLLDEPFQTQDIGRTGKAVEALFGSPLLEGWQVILLTKDERVAELCARAGAARLDLAGEGR
jgi:DNA repair exonuclease SbcCD ATPase subunit